MAVTRTFDSFDAAAEEAGRSRIYGGIHYQFDNATAQQVGGNVGGYVVDHFLLPHDHGGDELRAAAAAPVPVHGTPDAGRVQPLLAEALARWQAADGAIWLDDNAAGWVWFVDLTPRDDSEFSTPGDQGEAGRMDLLTALEHEIGHLLGRGHEPGGVMQDTLTAGERLTVSGADAGGPQVFVAPDGAGEPLDPVNGRRKG